MADPETIKGQNDQLQIALDAAVQENLRLTRELVDAEEGLNTLADLLALFVDTWRSGEPLEPIVDQVGETLKRLKRAHLY